MVAGFITAEFWKYLPTSSHLEKRTLMAKIAKIASRLAMSIQSVLLVIPRCIEMKSFVL